MSNKGEEGLYTSSHLREKLQSSQEDDLPANQDAGVLSDKAMRLVELMRKYDIDREKQQAFIKRIKQRDITQNINEAIRKDDFGYMSHALGRVNSQDTLTDYTRLKRLKDTFRKNGRTFVFKGEPDTGKTNFAFFIAELLKDMKGFDVISNLKSADLGDTFQSFEEMRNLTGEPGKKAVIIEDASNHLSGYALDRAKVEKYMRPYQNELAKDNAVLFLLGHTGSDIHAHLRRNAFLVDKKSKKSVDIYERVGNGGGEALKSSFNDVPATSVDYNSEEKTVFHWPDMDDGHTREEKINRIKGEIGNKLAENRVVKTVDLSEYKNSLVADALRKVAEQHDYLKFVENKSPYRVKKKR
ncbi:MAG: hypothetical protein ABEJ83_01790 [Candidatus Nanohaloarchaea archaeon]